MTNKVFNLSLSGQRAPAGTGNSVHNFKRSAVWAWVVGTATLFRFFPELNAHDHTALFIFIKMSNQSKRTPGPWELTGPTKKGYRHLSANKWSSFAKVVTVFEGHEIESTEGLANAHLIAAAPEMLDFIEKICSFWEKHNDTQMIPEYEYALNLIGKAKGIPPYESMEDLIKKAKGE